MNHIYKRRGAIKKYELHQKGREEGGGREGEGEERRKGRKEKGGGRGGKGEKRRKGKGGRKTELERRNPGPAVGKICRLMERRKKAEIKLIVRCSPVYV